MALENWITIIKIKVTSISHILYKNESTQTKSHDKRLESIKFNEKYIGRTLQALVLKNVANDDTIGKGKE